MAAGNQQVGQSGDAMTDIVAQVRRVSELIAEIGASTQQQTQGIGQVGDAVTQLDRVTQQNAALVEESAAAADSLSQQAAKLVEAVSVFKLDEAGAAHPAPLGGHPDGVPRPDQPMGAAPAKMKRACAVS